MENPNKRYEYAISALSGTPDEFVPAPPPPPKKRRPLGALVALLLVCALVVGGVGGVGSYLLMDRLQTESTAQNDGGGTPSANDGANKLAPLKLASSQNLAALSIHDIFAAGNLSTVAISTKASQRNAYGYQSQYASAGSGFILTEDGTIMTNYHVVENAGEITVMLHDGSEYPATFIGGDALTDIAVLTIDAENLTPVEIGNSDETAVGDVVVAIGNPLGELANSLSVGYISAMEREVTIDGTPRNMLQTNAAISPGNSGGPMFNVYGQVIGVITAKSVGDGVEGIGFAIPINKAAAIANELLINGYVKGRPYIGIECGPTLPNYNMPDGVYVSSVVEGGPADKAGLKQGDIIRRFDGEDVASVGDINTIKNELAVGDKVEIVVIRSGEEHSFTLALGETPAPDTSEASDAKSPSEDEMGGAEESILPNLPWHLFPGFGG